LHGLLKDYPEVVTPFALVGMEVHGLTVRSSSGLEAIPWRYWLASRPNVDLMRLF
jgi:hypothetical protein